MEKYENMTVQELEKKLRELKDLRDEVLEERDMILGQRNVHISSLLVTKYAKEIEEIEANIAFVEALIAQRNK
jgi:hypothetical protein